MSLYDDDVLSSTTENAVKPDQVDKDLLPVKKARLTETSQVDVSSCSFVSEKTTKNGRALISVSGCRKGEREEMQDAHVMIDRFLVPVDDLFSDITRSAFYAVFDGHAGPRAARFASENLHALIKEKLIELRTLTAIEKALKKTFIEAYRLIDERFLTEARKAKPAWKDGTTATTILILNNSLYAANIGDSRAIAVRFKPGDGERGEEVALPAVRFKPGDAQRGEEIALPITTDHSPQVFEERMRIQKAGGTVKDGRIMGQLEVSRSIGDGAYKAYGVTCLPDIKKLTLTPDDRYIVIACDGLWKEFSNQEVVEFISKALSAAKEDVKLTATETASVERLRWDRVAGELAAEAVQRGCGDNVTVLIIVL